MSLCHIALGGNIGDSRAIFGRALDLLDRLENCRVVLQSRLYRTSPVGEHSGGEFLNAAAAVETVLEPPELLLRLQNIERALGRTREVRWGARPIDLDLILWEDRIVDTRDLVVPHPAAWYRRFVLDPLAEIAGDVVHPAKRISIGQLRERLRVRPVTVGFAGVDAADWATSFHHRHVQFSEWRDANDGEPVILFWLGETPESDLTYGLLPLLPRLNVAQLTSGSSVQNVKTAIGHVLDSALDEPTLVK